MFLVLILFQILTSIFLQEDPSQPVSTVYVKQSGKDENSGLAIDQEKPSLNDAYKKLGDDIACIMKIVNDDSPLTAEAITFGKNKGITIEGVNSDGNGNTEVAIDCDVHPGSDLFYSDVNVEFKYLAFHIPTTLDKEGVQKYQYYSLINVQNASLTIRSCRFIRPESEGCHADFYLVYISLGSLTMDSVECSDEANSLTSEIALFNIFDAQTVTLSNLTLKKVETDAYAVFEVTSREKCDLTLNKSTFSECISHSYGTLHFNTSNDQSTFTVGDGGVTTFSSCHTDFDYSSALCLRMKAIKSANQLNWPEDGRNLIFENCTAGEDELKRNIGLFLEMANDSLFEEIASAMKKSFAANYTRRGHMWCVTGHSNSNNEDCDFSEKYFDPFRPPSQDLSKIFAKSGGTGNGESLEKPIGSLKEASELLGMITREDSFGIAILKSDDPIQAEEITLSKSRGIAVEGVNSDGNGNVEVAIDCDVSASSALFICEKEVEFSYLAFNFPTSGKKWSSLIFGNDLSSSLTISNCRFVRVGAQSPDEMATNEEDEEEDDDFTVGNLVYVSGGKVAMNAVTCTDERSTVSFSTSPFYFDGISAVSLNEVEISKVNVLLNPTIFIFHYRRETSSTVSIEGLNMNGVNSENGASAGLEISLVSKESTVTIGRNKKCSFKSCSAPKGKSGAILIELRKATSNLQLPSANNLEIDSSNTAGSKSTSLFIIAPDFEEFCTQEDAFEFANDYDNSTAGWIVVAKNDNSEPADVYEKYLKKPDPAPEGPASEEPAPEDKKKPNAGTVVAIVVPIVVVVVVAVVVVVVVIVVVKKRKAKSSKDENKDGSKEQEMSSQE
ncbi:uncharacterized protein MONOS_8619 [Monocercomonoides exilis]|uniref:uncharacterized protein n=1 Tax=Monocercomonoides exilis TaxID=2049356 RepID=UPI00355A79AC|nr:hypothetical protein MONOS_8619 [Monocercomonoides exilis]|eukprot:MONOS_8619.1-p1 / transcript=MONOS_8619.1 / gene=MONOS_8619 / organism=Monocercomonoides_exilis_PA203 / gene_product=unspecified product / transcript_product=unspecified product / location=Mono_scaffold00329:28908-31427(-) / protein_length=840 / sequence_SO=supercontig / SO=protein_coding / is_pseudo=false